jgi:hypothetical protein
MIRDPQAGRDEQYRIGDVIEDSYGNAAVVWSVDMAGRPATICQCAGSDRGRITSPPLHLRRVTSAAAIEWAKAIGRERWTELHARRPR